MGINKFVLLILGCQPLFAIPLHPTEKIVKLAQTANTFKQEGLEEGLAEQLNKAGYIELCNAKMGAGVFDTLYTHFNALIEFLNANPAWRQKLYCAKERFIRSKERQYYTTDFFGFYDESERKGRCQISFYYSIHFHKFVYSIFPEFASIEPFIHFFTACHDIQNTSADLFVEAAAALSLEQIFYSTDSRPPVLIKVVKYLPAYTPKKPHYDGTAFSLLLDSTANQALLLSTYKQSLGVDDFCSPGRKFARDMNQTSALLIPGTLLTEYSIFPTPHIVARNGKVRHATIAFAMRPNYTPPKIEFPSLPNFHY